MGIIVRLLKALEHDYSKWTQYGDYPACANWRLMENCITLCFYWQNRNQYANRENNKRK